MTHEPRNFSPRDDARPNPANPLWRDFGGADEYDPRAGPSTSPVVLAPISDFAVTSLPALVRAAHARLWRTFQRRWGPNWLLVGYQGRTLVVSGAVSTMIIKAYRAIGLLHHRWPFTVR